MKEGGNQLGDLKSSHAQGNIRMQGEGGGRYQQVIFKGEFFEKGGISRNEYVLYTMAPVGVV